MKFTFWFSLLIVFYAYFGYVILLMVLDGWQRMGRRAKPLQASGHPRAEHELPKVSFIITAYNEELSIARKIENTLALSYPLNKREIIVASDCSDDKTDEIVGSYAEQGIVLIRAQERKGKEHAQMHAVRAAIGDVLVFSDVSTMLRPNAINQIVDNFRDPSVGCVSSEDRFIDQDGRVSGEGLYVRYEMYLRALESRVNTLVGMSGSFFAARREVCRNWAPDLQSDFNTLMNTVKVGMKGVSDPQSIGYYENIADERKEFQRKVRTVLRGMTVLIRNRHLMNPLRHGLFAWQLLSHKLCRWVVPVFLLSAFWSNAMLLGAGKIYVGLFVAQTSLYAAAVWHGLNRKPSMNAPGPLYAHRTGGSLMAYLRSLAGSVASIAYYFTSVNIAIFYAWIKFSLGHRTTSWEPSRR